jgi:glycosyltransferase involved in cell wall biosynthesis
VKATLTKGDRSPLPGEAGVTVSVVIPTLNEADNLGHVLPRIPGWIDEVVLVDGGSTDGTVDRARRLRPDIEVVIHLEPGKGAALRRGFEAARGDIIVMLDADGSMDPGEIRSFVAALMGGADFAKGSRFLHGGGTTDMEWYRKAGNMVLTRLVRLGFGGRYSDLCYGYNAFWSDVVDRLGLDADGFEIETLMNIRALRAGLEVAEVASFEAPRVHGTSNLNTVVDGWRVLRTIVRERAGRRPLPRPTVDLRGIGIEPGPRDLPVRSPATECSIIGEPAGWAPMTRPAAADS